MSKILRRMKPKVRPAAITFTLWIVLAYLIVAALGSFGVFNFSIPQNLFLFAFVGLFILVNEGIWGRKKLNQPKGIINWLLTIAALILLVGVLFGVLGWGLGAFLGGLFGIVTSFLAIVLLVSLLLD